MMHSIQLLKWQKRVYTISIEFNFYKSFGNSLMGASEIVAGWCERQPAPHAMGCVPTAHKQSGHATILDAPSLILIHLLFCQNINTVKQQIPMIFNSWIKITFHHFPVL